MAVNRFSPDDYCRCFYFVRFLPIPIRLWGTAVSRRTRELGHVLYASTTGKKAMASNRIRRGHDGRVSGDDKSIHKYVKSNGSEGSHEPLSLERTTR